MLRARPGGDYYREDVEAWYVRESHAQARAESQTRHAADWDGARYVVRHRQDLIDGKLAILRRAGLTCPKCGRAL